MEKYKQAEELFKQGYNCAQAVFRVLSEEYGIDFETAMKLSSALGGGMGRMREVCGAVSAMFLAVGLKYSDTKNKAEVYEIVQDMANEFKSKHSTIICRQLLEGIETSTEPTPSERTDEYYQRRPCVKFVRDAVKIFENYERPSKD